MSAAPAVSLNELPGPRGLPILGNLLQLDLKRLHLILEDWARSYGDLYTFRIGTRLVLAVSDPALIQQILHERPEKFGRLPTIEPVFKEMGLAGLFTSEGEEWKRQRRVWMKAVNTNQTRQFFEKLIEITARLRKRWGRAAASGEPVDIQADLMRFTVDVTARFALGHDPNTLEQDGDIIQQHLNAIFPMVNRRINAPFPYWRYIKLPIDHRLDRELAALREAIFRLIAQARERIAANPQLAAQPTNLLEAMLVTKDADGSGFNDEEIYGNALTVLVAGEDTTANTLSWVVDFLTRHPEVQRRMQEEADTVLGASTLWTQPAEAERFRYLDAVLSETVRQKTVAPIIFLGSNVDVELGGVSVPAGTDVLLLLRVAAVSETQFEQPAEFRPERWLAPDQPGFTMRPPTPFGSGPRMCPGRTLAMSEIRSVMAMLARNFEVEHVEGSYPVEELFSFAMMPLNLRVRLRERAMR